MEYPRLRDLNSLSKQLHVVGTILEVSPGYCGWYCQGGYIKVQLNHDDSAYSYKSLYIITACLPREVKSGTKVDLTATLHTSRDVECYYVSFDRPKNMQDLVFYKLSETETQKIPHQIVIFHGSF